MWGSLPSKAVAHAAGVGSRGNACGPNYAWRSTATSSRPSQRLECHAKPEAFRLTISGRTLLPQSAAAQLGQYQIKDSGGWNERRTALERVSIQSASCKNRETEVAQAVALRPKEINEFLGTLFGQQYVSVRTDA